MTALAQKLFWQFEIGDEMKAFGRWVLVWLVLANLGFVALWFVGAPTRWLEIIVIAIFGYAAKNMPYWIKAPVFVMMMTWTILLFVADVFNLDLPRIVRSLHFILQMQPASSPVYLAACGVVLLMMGLALYVLRRDTNFKSGYLQLAAVLAVAGLSYADHKMTVGMVGHYKRAAPQGAPFSSAVQQTGFAASPDGKRHLLLVVVESLGTPANKDMNNLLFAEFKSSEKVRERFDISTGNSPYYGSTTAAEIREMCGYWGDYDPLLGKKDADCLPSRLARQGYQTISMHSFDGKFFDREKWYPTIGFQHIYFAPELMARGVEACGGVFPGVCDRGVAAEVTKELKAAAKPTFLYWLTVNSHLPLLPGHNLQVENCGKLSASLKQNYPQLCGQAAVFADLDHAIIKEITAADFPATDILLVGDHMPPFFDKHHRSQMDPEHVPWLHLKHKSQ